MISLTARRASCYTRTRSTHRQQRAIVTASTQSGETNAPATATGTARSAVNTSGPSPPMTYIPFTVTQQQADFRYDSLYDSMFYRRFGATRNTAKSATCQRIFVPVHILEADFDVVCDYEGAASTSGSALPPAATPLRRPDSFNARLFRTLQAEIADDVVADMMHARAAVHDDDAKSMTQTLRRRVALSGFQQKEYVCDSSYEALISKIMNATAGMNKNDGEDMLPPSLLSLPQSLITSMEILRKTQHRGSTANAHDGASSLDLRRIPLRLVPPPPSIVAGAEAEAVTAGSTPISENRPFIPSTIVHDALDEFCRSLEMGSVDISCLLTEQHFIAPFSHQHYSNITP